jgi:hypothetical protein
MEPVDRLSHGEQPDAADELDRHTEADQEVDDTANDLPGSE